MNTTVPTEKPKFPLADAQAIAAELISHLGDFAERIEIAGSIRRKKAQVGDIEILYIPTIGEQNSGDLLGTLESVNYFDLALGTLEEAGILERRLNIKGSETYGEQNKLMRHVRSGIPIDFFATTEANWFNYLVCRTGGLENNKAIATAALKRGLQWKSTGPGFAKKDGGIIAVQAESQVFTFVGLPYLPPEERS